MLPLLLAGPRRTVETAFGAIPLEYGFRTWWWRTERCVEIAIAKHVLNGREASSVLEVGNVLALAGVAGHAVVDKYEPGPGVLNVDIIDFQPARRYDIAVSISTLEHVGFDEHPQDPEKATVALAHLAGLADQLLVTIPVGYNREFDGRFVEGPFDVVELLVKTSRLGRWESRPIEQAASIRYGSPYSCGNAVLVGSRGLSRA